MQLQAQLVHAEPGQRVVQVSAHRDGMLLGSALGEAGSAEEAEDRAIRRLQARLDRSPPPPLVPELALAPPEPEPEPEEALLDPDQVPELDQELEPWRSGRRSPSQAAAPGPRAAAPGRPPTPTPDPDPEDWSAELVQIDQELKRLGWQRDQEGIYLQRAFGHPSRSRITAYADLQAYLGALAAVEPGTDPAAAVVPLSRRELLEQCDALLGQLRWDANQGRLFLERHFPATSRQQLSDPELLRFNMLLESELLDSAAVAPDRQPRP